MTRRTTLAARSWYRAKVQARRLVSAIDAFAPERPEYGRIAAEDLPRELGLVERGNW